MKKRLLQFGSWCVRPFVKWIKSIMIWWDLKFRSDKQVVEDYLQNADANLLKFAQAFANQYGVGKWMTVDYMFKKQDLFESQAEFVDVLKLLCLSQLCTSKEENGIVKFRLTLTKEDKVKALKLLLADIDKERARVEKQIKALQKSPTTE